METPRAQGSRCRTGKTVGADRNTRKAADGPIAPAPLLGHSRLNPKRFAASSHSSHPRRGRRLRKAFRSAAYRRRSISPCTSTLLRKYFPRFRLTLCRRRPSPSRIIGQPPLAGRVHRRGLAAGVAVRRAAPSHAIDFLCQPLQAAFQLRQFVAGRLLVHRSLLHVLPPPRQNPLIAGAGSSRGRMERSIYPPLVACSFVQNCLSRHLKRGLSFAQKPRRFGGFEPIAP